MKTRAISLALFALLAAVSISGCQAVQGSGPRMDNASSLSPEALPYDVIDLTPQSVVAYRPVPIPAQTAPVIVAPTRFTVGPDDVLKVHIVERYAGGIFATLAQSDTLVVTRRVGPSGTIDVPFVGRVQATGRELPQIESEILSRLAGKANEPQVTVELEADRTNTITVSGDVSKPGPLSLMDGTRTVIEAINRAGGPSNLATQGGGGGGAPQGGGSLVSSSSAGLGGYGLSTSSAALNRSVITPQPKTLGDATQMRIVVRRQGHVVLDKAYSQVLIEGDFPLQKGDEVVVSPNSQVVTLLGAVQKSGNLPIVKPDMNLADALGDSSGLIDPIANKSGIYIFRPAHTAFNESDRGRIFRLDMSQPVSFFIARQFALHPRDVIYVSNAPMYEYDKVLTPIYRTLYAVSAARNQ